MKAVKALNIIFCSAALLLSLSACSLLDRGDDSGTKKSQLRSYADHVVVNKSRRSMKVMAGNKLLAHYRISIGSKSIGDKQREGDKRTPEGNYVLDFVKEDSAYYRAFHISYPNPLDIAEAQARGDDPGGEIFIHGQPNGQAHRSAERQAINWTAGCIALTNQEIDEFIALVPLGTPIMIGG